MKAIRNVLLILLVVGVLVFIWDAIPFYATDSSTSDNPASTRQSDLAIATFSGGCFWCMEKPFDELNGVVSTTSGYTGGSTVDPSYGEVSAGGTGHLESVQVTYEPSQVSYETLLNVFWKNVDPVDNQGQFCDKGSQYRSAIFTQNEEQSRLARASKQAISDLEQFRGTSIATEIRPAQTFYPAEEYHQDYYLKHPVHYKFYRNGCGRDQRLNELWGEN
jgi:peptide-methionine (S)-S-oxide reductase